MLAFSLKQVAIRLQHFSLPSKRIVDATSFNQVPAGLYSTSPRNR
jgi:hypothetical protein